MKDTSSAWLRFALLMVLAILFGFPLYWMAVTSLQPPRAMASANPSLIPRTITLDSYRYMLARPGFVHQFRNSTVVAVVTTVVSTGLATLAGYGFSRFRFRGREGLSSGILTFQMFPKVLLVIPYFMMLRSLGLLSSHLGLIIAYTSFTQPFCVWLLKGFFDSIPQELDEAAMVDGASRLGAFYRVVVPLAAPGVAATALYAFVLSWQEFLFSLVLAVDPKSALLPQGLASLVQELDTLYEPMMAGAIMVSIPVVLVYILLERHFVRGLTAGAVKG